MTKFTLDGIDRLSSVYIMLGAACNMKCRHCIEVKMPRLKKVVSPDVIEYLKQITESKPIKLVFFGGEPFLYKEQMRQIVSAVNGRADITVITNGALIDDDDVEWLNTNEIAIAFSNDGPNTEKTGRENMLDNPEFLNRFLRIKRKGFEGVIHAHSQDLQKATKYLQEKVPGILVYWGDLVVTAQCPDDYVDFDNSVLEKNEDLLVREVMKMAAGEPYDNSIVDLVVRKAKIARARLTGTLKDGFACGVIGHTINVDLQGNVFLCHACDIKLGTIYDSLSELQMRSHETAETIRKLNEEAKGCTDCEARYFCAGKCPLEPPSENQKKGCKAVISLWRAVDKSLKQLGEFYENP